MDKKGGRIWQGQGFTEAQGTHSPAADDGASRYEELWTVYRQSSDTRKRCEMMGKVSCCREIWRYSLTGKEEEQDMLSRICSPKRQSKHQHELT